MMANVHMEVFNRGINRGFFFNSPTNSSFSVHNFAFCHRPNSSITSKCMLVRKGCNLVGRKPKLSGFSTHKFNIVSALGNGEVEANSTSVELVEKELKFSPMFQDYLKIMESVRMGRREKPNGNMDAASAQKRSIESSRDREKAKSKNRKYGDVEKRGSGWELGEIILEKKTLERSGDNLMDVKYSSNKELNTTSDSRDDDHFENETVGFNKLAYRNRREIGSADGLNRISSRINNIERVGNRSWKNYVKKVNHVNIGLDGTRDTTAGVYFKKERVGSNKVKEQNVVAFQSVDELRIHTQSDDPVESRSIDRFNEINRVGNNFVKNYVNKANHINSGRGAMGGVEMKENLVEQPYENNVGKKMFGLEGSNIVQNRKSTIRINTYRKLDNSLIIGTWHQSGNFNQTNVSKKSHGSEFGNNRVKDGNSSRMEQWKTGGNLSVNKIGILEKEMDRSTISRRYFRIHDNSKTTENFGSRSIEMQGLSAKSNTQLDKIGWENHGMDIEDRAAFRTFEVFTDVRNRPRVLRMEMEERIQKLAKWLNATDINMPEWQFSKMMHGAKTKFTEHSILRVVQILGGQGNWRRALQVVQWLQSRERFKSYKSRYIYTSVLDVLGKARRPIEALNMFYAMRQELSSYPDLAAYHCIAVTLGQAGLMKELFDVIDCMRSTPEKKFKLGPLQKWDPRLEPDLIVYNAVLNACVQHKKWEGAFWVLQQLKYQNIRPSNTTLGLIMEVMLECGKYNLVHEFFRKVEKTSIPSALNYKVLVNTLWREGKVDEAVLAVSDMERRGVVGSASLYYDLARCLCSAGRCREALLQIDKICKVANKPLVVTYTGLIQACLDSGNIENGTYIFNEMHKYCSPNTITCNIMLKSYIEHGMYNEAKNLFQKMLDGSHQIKSKYDLAQKANPDKFTFNTMMDACAATNNWDDFEDAYEQMLHHGFHFDRRRHLRLVLDAFRAGKEATSLGAARSYGNFLCMLNKASVSPSLHEFVQARIIETTWTHLIQFGRDPPPPIILERFCIKLQEDNHLAAISCFEVYQGKEMHAFSERTWSNLLKNNAHGFKNYTIFRLTQELKLLVDESNWSHSVYRNLLNACRNLDEITNYGSTRS